MMMNDSRDNRSTLKRFIEFKLVDVNVFPNMYYLSLLYWVQSIIHINKNRYYYQLITFYNSIKIL